MTEPSLSLASLAKLEWPRSWSFEDPSLPWLLTGALFLTALVVGLGLTRALRVLVRTGHFPPTMAKRLTKVFWWFIAFLALATVLQNTRLFEQAWAVVSGITLALAVAFVALWSVLSNAVCALLILAFRPFRIGDNVEVIEPSDGKAGVGGRVYDLSLMFTTLEGEDAGASRTLIRMPNSVFFQKAVRVTFPRETTRTTFFDVREQGSTEAAGALGDRLTINTAPITERAGPPRTERVDQPSADQPSTERADHPSSDHPTVERPAR